MPNFRYFQIHAIKDHITFNKTWREVGTELYYPKLQEFFI